MAFWILIDRVQSIDIMQKNNPVSAGLKKGFLDMRINNIDRARCYGFTITADGVMADGMSFHNTTESLIEILMAIVAHYAGYAVRWRFQAERGHQTHRLHFQGFIDFGCVVKVRTVMHWLPEGLYLSPVRDTPADIQRAADYCIKTDTRVEMPHSYGFNDGFDVNGGSTTRVRIRECESFNIGGSVVGTDTDTSTNSDFDSIDDWLDSVCDDDDSIVVPQSDDDNDSDSDSMSFDDWFDSMFDDDDSQSDSQSDTATQSDAKSEAPLANRQSDAQYDEDSIDAWLDDFWRELESRKRGLERLE